MTSDTTDPKGTSRRQFIGKTAGAVAAASVIAGSTSAASPQEGQEVTIDTSVRWNTPPGDLYNETRGYGVGHQADDGEIAVVPQEFIDEVAWIASFITGGAYRRQHPVAVGCGDGFRYCVEPCPVSDAQR